MRRAMRLSAWWPSSSRRASASWYGQTHGALARAITDSEGSHWPEKATVVFTDPDSTFLQRGAQPCVAAREALRFLANQDVPLVLCSSRTRAELETLQQELDVHHPFVSENGGAVYLPRGYFSKLTDASGRAGYGVLPFGEPYQRVVEILQHTAERLGIEVLGFNDMSVQEVADEWGIALAEARLAKLREHDEPFRILDSDPAVRSRLFTALRRAGLRCFIGDRFHHVTGGTDISASVRTLMALYRLEWGDIRTVGIADGLVDAALLQEVDLPIVVWNTGVDGARVLRKMPRARVTHAAGGEGWSEAIFAAVTPVPHPVSKGT